MKPRILVLGAGSIGTRHARNLEDLGAAVTVADPDLERASATGFDVVQVPTGPDGSDAFDQLDRFDGYVIASPTRHHAAQVRAILALGGHVLVEKPMAESLTDARSLLGPGDDRLMVGYNLRLHAPVERLVGLVHGGVVGRVVAARLWFGSWLPDWRPDVDYRRTYSARADLGGGVLNDAIHELDLAVWLMQCNLSVQGAIVAKVGPLEIDVEDTVRALLVSPDGVPVEIELDYLSRRYRRGIEVVGDDASVVLDWSRQTIEIHEPGGVTIEEASEPVARSYEREAERFLDFIRGGCRPPVDAREGLRSIELVEAIRAAAT